MPINEYCDSQIAPVAALLDSDPRFVIEHLRELLKLKRDESFSNADLEHVFGASVALAFTLWQHLAAVERLSAIEDLNYHHRGTLAELKRGELTCGLATTHLASKSVAAKYDWPHFIVSGRAPWVSGSTFFEKLILGFETEDEYLFALIDFPDNQPQVQIKPIELSSMNGTATATLVFENFNVATDSIISRRKINAAPAPRPSQYAVPELGIAKACLRRLMEREQAKVEITGAITSLAQRIERLEAERKNPTPLLVFEMSEVVRDSVRLLAIAEGGTALSAKSFVSRTQANILLLDAVIQSNETLNLKVQSIAAKV